MASDVIKRTAGLKLCPFCGDRASLHYVDNYPYTFTTCFICCDVCHSRTADAESIEQAIGKWNFRAPQVLSMLPAVPGTELDEH